MVKKVIREYTENGVAYNVLTTYFFGVMVYKNVSSTTNASTVQMLKTQQQKHKTIKGYEA